MSSWSLGDIPDDKPMTRRTPKKVPSFVDACGMCSEAIVRYHLSRPFVGDEINAQDESGKTGLCHICANGFTELLNILHAKAGTLADPNIGDNEGNTPLIYAAQAGHVEVVSTLLHGFGNLNIDQTNHNGFTALMKAAIQGRTRCAKLLLMAGASTVKKDYSRRFCALEWANFVGRRNTAKTIKQYMVDTGDDDLLTVPDMGASRCRSASSIDTIGLPERRSSLRVNERRCSSSFARSSLRKPAAGRKFSLSPQQELQISQGIEQVVRVTTVAVVPEHSSEVSENALSKRRSLVAQMMPLPIIEVTLSSKDDNFYFEKRYSLKNRRNSGPRRRSKDEQSPNRSSGRRNNREEMTVPDRSPRRKNSREERARTIKMETVDVFKMN